MKKILLALMIVVFFVMLYSPNLNFGENHRSTVLGLSNSPVITLTSPNGGETWHTGETHNITWTTATSGNYEGLLTQQIQVLTGHILIVLQTPVQLAHIAGIFQQELIQLTQGYG